MRDGKRRGRPPGAKNRIKVESMKDGEWSDMTTHKLLFQ
jgi:hypothetical protein